MKGKAKELFEKWLICNYKDEYISGHTHLLGEYSILLNSVFNKLPTSMQWGVKQDFYDSQGIHILPLLNSYETDNWDFIIEIENETIYSNSKYYKTRPEAREAALLKAEEILNNKP